MRILPRFWFRIKTSSESQLLELLSDLQSSLPLASGLFSNATLPSSPFLSLCPAQPLPSPCPVLFDEVPARAQETTLNKLIKQAEKIRRGKGKGEVLNLCISMPILKPHYTFHMLTKLRSIVHALEQWLSPSVWFIDLGTERGWVLVCMGICTLRSNHQLGNKHVGLNSIQIEILWHLTKKS